MKRYALDVIRDLGGGYRCFDEAGQEVREVGWIDAEAGTFGQYMLDDEGRKQKDPDDPSKPWMIERIGRLRLERIDRSVAAIPGSKRIRDSRWSKLFKEMIQAGR